MIKDVGKHIESEKNKGLKNVRPELWSKPENQESYIVVGSNENYDETSEGKPRKHEREDGATSHEQMPPDKFAEQSKSPHEPILDHRGQDHVVHCLKEVNLTNKDEYNID